MKKIKEIFDRIGSRKGGYSVTLIVLVLLVSIVLNFAVGKLPEKMTQLDLSDNHLYEITDTSKKMLTGLKNNINIYLVAEKGSVDERITKFVKLYTGLSDQVQLKELDPVTQPSVLSKYNTEQDTVVVECPDTGKSISISLSDMITTDSYYGSESSFDVEGQLTGAIRHVTSDSEKQIYVTSGHGETALSDSVSALMKKSNYIVSDVNLMMTTMPEDCDLLLINGPTSDLADEELKTIDTYMQNGGHVMILLNYEEEKTPNLDTLLAEYGMKQVDGYIADTERAYSGGGSAYYIFPVLSLSEDLTAGLNSSDDLVMMAYSQGMEATDPARDTITTTPFMSTSEKGVAVTEDEEQTNGTFILGAVATENDSRMTMMGSLSLIDAQITDSFQTLKNLTLFMNAVSANFDDAKENTAIEAKSLTISYNTPQQASALSYLTIFGIPLLILIGGFWVWIRRKKV